jgi:DNA-directed RNA polymerase specialized sigma24 family protein
MARPRLDADLLAAAYEREARRMLVLFTQRLYDAQLAVDVVAETYARAFELRRRFRGDPTDPEALAGWVFGAIFAPAPPLPDAARPPGAVAPLHAGS